MKKVITVNPTQPSSAILSHAGTKMHSLAVFPPLYPEIRRSLPELAQGVKGLL